MNNCPDRDRLERLLDHRLDVTELDEVEEHVEGCANCQHTLDELTDAKEWGLKPGRDGSDTPADVAPGRVVDPLGDTAGASAGARDRMARVVPTIVGYEIVGELGRGGMGVVYQARHVRLNRLCALKMILAGAHASDEEVARFVTEAEAIAHLAHPSIIQIRHIGETDGLPFLELEYVTGGSLDQALDGTPWPPVRAALLAEQVALAIAEAHRERIVHRDLKPSNILLAADGTPKVGDFGLAKMLDNKTALTGTESVMGSPSYMAPEQAQGRAKEAGAPVDLYSLGAILYELLTGRPPFRGATALETLEQVTSTEPVPPSRLVPGLPHDVETICLKCLQKEPGKRYETAEALGDDLRRFLEGRPIVARRISGAERAWRWCRRNRFVAGMTAIAATAVLALAVGATTAALTFRAQRDQIRHADRQTRENLLESLTAQARATRFSGQLGQRFESLAALDRATRIARELELPSERFERLRDEAIACLALPDMRKAGRVIPRPPGILMVAFDSTMSRYALRFRDGTIQVRIVDHDQKVAHFRARGDRHIPTFLFSPDGRYLATTHYPDRGLTVWDVDREAVVLDEKGPFLVSARFSPENREIALAQESGEILVVDLESRRPRRLRSGQEPPKDLAFRPDGIQLAVTNRDPMQPTCRILELKSGRVVQTLSLRSPAAVAWSSDGTTLAMLGDDSKIDLFHAPTGTRTATLEGSVNTGLRGAFHPAGTLLASNGWENRLRLWDAVVGRPLFSLPATNIADFGVSAGGRVVLVSDDELTTYQVEPALEYRLLAHVSRDRMAYEIPSIRPDNRLLAVGSNTGVALWDLARGTEYAFLPIGIARRVMFEATGDLLTGGSAGVCRWPVQLDAKRGEFRIGPPRQIFASKSNCGITEDREGRIVALASFTRAEIQISGRMTHVGPLDDCRDVAVSPDGQWLAIGSHHLGAQVWRVSDQMKVADLPIDWGTRVAFSTDGNRLMTQNAPCRLWATNTWTLSRELGGRGLCFSPDSRLVALVDARRVINLVEAASGRVIARLESPDAFDVTLATFSPDGSRLAVTTQAGPAVHVWDLRAIRRRLAAMGLDWNAPAYSEDDPAGPAAASLPPLEIDLGPLAGGSSTSPSPPRH